ncbi:ferritin-like domain-containing protein [Roseomonas sp. CECT 9278]|uniref:YciE/YciF ferroxidase family protein n=1 Tax=Roseomonas sp. CECT 9278 TaxID=2845823 RepID=UPI001E453C6F|nr:ferritin-like domain-containing protein [Roseomonas sp. CECT 9278]CAH0250319.1 Protein YciF [Roseomonas sp. CECT 9278]
MAAMKTLDDLFLHTLKDIYFAERQILKALPRMAKAAESEALRDDLLAHRDETQGQIERLQQVFDALGRRAQGVTCEAIKGLIEECVELVDDTPEAGSVRDAGLIACAQAVEHYEMARYGALIAWARAGRKPEIVALLEANLAEEKAADGKLTKAAREINMAAMQQAA